MSAADIDRIAAQWAARMDAGEMSASDQTLLAAWQAEDPRHAGSLLRMLAVLQRTARGAALGPQFSREQTRRIERKRRGTLAWASAAASVLLVVVVAGVFLANRADEAVFRTAIGEVRRLPLSDGSVLSINTDSQLSVRMQQDQRQIFISRGEAAFDVAKDQRRPFVVSTPTARVTAVGTRFSVRVLADSGIEVLVEEGRVRVDEGEGEARFLDANMRAVGRSTQSLSVSHIVDDSVRQSLAWQEGMVVFANQPLAVAVSEYNRYNAVKILLQQDALESLPVIGRFSATDPHGFAQALAFSLGLRVSSDDKHIYLSRGDSTGD